ncbi:MFS transporter [Streptomyces sp. NPDC079020]|uniref:MFS transporter n=1 Tax=Streptomyces sp. NPDC079020 TaxID=3365722 RepID=UPI0037D6FA12
MSEQQRTRTEPAEPGQRPRIGGIRRPSGRLLALFGPASFSISLVWGSVPSILLALQVQDIYGQEHKVAMLAVVTTSGAVAAMLIQPIAGALSDRTRSRFGRRAPWMALGALTGGLALIGLAVANDGVTLTIAWVTVQLGLGLATSPMTAVMPDRVPRTLRGTFASVWGLGAMLGSLGGQIYVAAFAENIPAGYLLLAGIVMVTITLYVIICPDTSSRDLPPVRFSLRAFARAYWVNPVKNPDFAWAFISRLFAYAGYYIVFGYKLYILQDYIGLGDDAVDVVALIGVVMVVGLFASTLAAGRISDRIGRRKVFVVAASLLVSAAVLIPLVSPTVTGMLFMAGVGGIGFGCFQAVDTALISEVLPSEHDHAKDLGVVNIAVTIPQILAPGVAGAVVVATGGYAALFPIGTVFGILAALCILRVKSVR